MLRLSGQTLAYNACISLRLACRVNHFPSIKVDQLLSDAAVKHEIAVLRLSVRKLTLLAECVHT